MVSLNLSGGFRIPPYWTQYDFEISALLCFEAHWRSLRTLACNELLRGDTRGYGRPHGAGAKSDGLRSGKNELQQNQGQLPEISFPGYFEPRSVGDHRPHVSRRGASVAAHWHCLYPDVRAVSARRRAHVIFTSTRASSGGRRPPGVADHHVPAAPGARSARAPRSAPRAARMRSYARGQPKREQRHSALPGGLLAIARRDLGRLPRFLRQNDAQRTGRRLPVKDTKVPVPR